MSIIQDHFPLLALVLGLLGTYSAVAFGWHKEALKTTGYQREWRLAWTRRHTFHQIYADAFLDPFLDFLGNRIIGDSTRVKSHHPFVRSFTATSFEFCLRCAYIGPPLIFFITWLFGFSGSVGGHQILPPSGETQLLSKILFVMTIISVLFNYIAIRTTSGPKRWLSIVGLCLMYLIILSMSLRGWIVPLLIATAIVTAADAINVISGIVFFPLFFAVMVLVDAKNYLFLFIFSLMAFRIWSGAHVLRAIEVSEGYRAWRYFYFVSFVLMAYFYALTIPRSLPGLDAWGVNSYLFSILPIVYAQMVWISLALGRGLLDYARQGRHSGLQSFVLALADFVIALVLVATSCQIIAITVALTDRLSLLGGNKPFFDVPTLLFRIGYDPWNIDFYWIYGALGFIALPIVFHSCIAGGAIALWVPRRLLSWVSSGWDNVQGDNVNIDKLNILSSYLAIAPIIGIVGVLFSFGLFLWLTFYILLSPQSAVSMLLLHSIAAVYRAVSGT